MDKKTQKILLIGAVGVVAYFWWKKRQETNGLTNGLTDGEEETSSFGGRRKRKKADKAMSELCTYCSNHSCNGAGCNGICGCPRDTGGGLAGGGGQGSTGTGRQRIFGQG